MDVRIEYVPLSELRRWPRNPKDHDLGILHQSLARFGFVNPLIIDERTGQLVAGHGRLDALIQIKTSGQNPPERIKVAEDGEWLIPVIRGIRFNSDIEAEAYALADNRTVELGGWIEDKLAGVLKDLAEMDALDGIGWDEDDVDELLKKIEVPSFGGVEEAPEPQIDRAEELREEWGVERGQIWEIPSKTVEGGVHRVMCGDSTDKTSVAQLFKGQKAPVVITDPPYNVALPEGHLTNNELFGNAAGLFHREFVAALHVTNDCSAIVFHSPRQFILALDAFRDEGWEFKRTLWMYEQGGRAFPWHGWYMTGEIILCFQRGKGSWVDVVPVAVPDTYAHSVGIGSNEQGIKPGKDSKKADLYHPTLKPLWIVRDLVQHTCGNPICDPFVGAGTTIVGSEQVGRIGYGMEIEPKYVAVTLQRLADMGLEPRKVES